MPSKMRAKPVAHTTSHGLTISTVCFRAQPLAGALETAKRLGFDRVDLAGLRGLCEHAPVGGTPAAFAEATRTIRESGLAVSSINADPGSFDGTDDPLVVHERIDDLLAFARGIGAPLLVLPCGEKHENRNTDGARPAPLLPDMSAHLNRVADRADAAGIRLAVEAPYFGRPVDDVARTIAFTALLDDRIGLAFDTSHVIAAGDDLTDSWHALRDRVDIVHVRDAVRGDIRRVIGAGDLDVAALRSMLAESSYRGDVVLELETRSSPYASKEDEVVAALGSLGDIVRPTTPRREDALR